MAPQAPAAAAPGPRPSSPKVFGILSIVFGSLVLLFSLAGIVSSGTVSELSGLGMDREIRQEMEALASMTVYQPIIWAAMSGWLLAIGIGQVTYRRWAARHAVAWGILGIVCVVGLAIFTIVVTGPMMERLSGAAGLDVSFGLSMLGGGAVVGAVLYLPYPILQIVFFRKNPVVESMT